MTSANIRQPFLKLLPIQMAAIVVGSVNSLVDTMFTSRFLGMDAMAGIGFFSPVLTIIYLCYVILNGAQILCGRAVGKGKSDEVTSLFTTAIVTVFGYGTVLAGAVCAFRVPLAALLGARGAAAEHLISYIAGYMPGAPFLMLNAALMMFMPCNNDIRRSYVVMGILVASNLLLDYLAICVLDMKTLGLGLATTLSYALSCLITLPRFFRKDKAYRIEPKTVKLARMGEAARLGLPELAFNLGITLRSYVMNLSVMGVIGAMGVAVLNVQNMLLGFMGAIPGGIAGAYTIMGSIYYGEKDRHSLCSLTKLALKTSALIGGIVIAALLAGSSLVAGLFFASGTAVFALARQMLMCFSSTFLLNSIQKVFTRAYQIEGEMKMVNGLNFMEQVFTGLVAAVGIRFFGPAAVWCSCPAAELICLMLIYVWLMRRMKRRPRSVEDWLNLPPSFGALPEDVLEFTVSSLEEVNAVSGTIMDFCERRGIDRRRRNVAGLSVEEMAGNVISYGLADGKNHTVEIRVVAEDPLIIRIRDNCAAFDPKKRIDQFYPEDISRNAGIRLIGHMADSMDYHNDAGINTLLIRV